jgi:hypothetical protein
MTASPGTHDQDDPGYHLLVAAAHGGTPSPGGTRGGNERWRQLSGMI